MVDLIFVVGVAGFEPATFCPPDKRATRLRYTPKEQIYFIRDTKNNKRKNIFIKTIIILFL